MEKVATFGKRDGKSMMGLGSLGWDAGRAAQCKASAASRMRAMLGMCIVNGLGISGYLALL